MRTKYDTKTFTPKELFDWMTDKKATATTSVMRSVMFTNKGMQKYRPQVGKLYFYQYDPKWKHVLPIYDIYPLVFPIDYYPDGFLGINVHYLPKNVRGALFTKLEDYATNPRYPDNKRLQLSYQLLKQSTFLSVMTENCLKRYLYDHVRSWFVEIPFTEWERAYQLPVQRFITKK